MVTLSRILGPDGQPLRLDDLTEPQTARVTQLRHDWQGHPSRGLTPSRLAQILDDAEQGNTLAQFELFEDMEEKDAHIASEMDKRRRAMLLLDWDITPPSNPDAAEKSAAVELKELLTDVPDFEDTLFDITDAIGKGFSNLEIEWHRADGYWLPKSITHRPQGWFTLARGYRQDMHLRTGAGSEPLQPFGWITHIHKAKSGYLERAALFRVLVWPYLFKNYSVADLAEFLEIYGIPLRVGRYPPGAREQEKATLLRALVNIGHNAAGIIPEGMLMEFHDAASGDPAAFQLMIDWCERSASKAILGGTLTSQADGKTSTHALGEVHNEVCKDLRKSDMRQVAGTLSRDLIYPIAALNGLAPNLRRAPRFRFNDQDTEDIGAYAAALPSLVKLGMRIKRQWAQERLGIPEPEPGEEVLTLTPPLENQAVATARQPAGDAPQTMRAMLDRDLQPATADWLNAIRALIDRAESLSDIRDGLERLLPDLTLEHYAAAMAQALAAAALAGRYDILQEVAVSYDFGRQGPKPADVTPPPRRPDQR